LRACSTFEITEWDHPDADGATSTLDCEIE